jgi:hypothetical protein
VAGRRTGGPTCGDSGARIARKSVRPKSVTYVAGSLCYPCLRARPTVAKVRLFGLGVDGYIVEPFDRDEFLARVKALQ